MLEVVAILMQRDNLTQREAEEYVAACKSEIEAAIDAGEEAEDILQDNLGLEPDYLFDVLAYKGK